VGNTGEKMSDKTYKIDPQEIVQTLVVEPFHDLLLRALWMSTIPPSNRQRACEDIAGIVRTNFASWLNHAKDQPAFASARIAGHFSALTTVGEEILTKLVASWSTTNDNEESSDRVR
jgi:hypothetical protein